MFFLKMRVEGIPALLMKSREERQAFVQSIVVTLGRGPVYGIKSVLHASGAGVSAAGI